MDNDEKLKNEKKDNPFKRIRAQLVRIEGMIRENKELTSIGFILTTILLAIGFFADFATLFGSKDNKVVVNYDDEVVKVTELEKSDFMPEFFLYQKLGNDKVVLVDLQPSLRAVPLAPSTKFSGSCDNVSYHAQGWYPVEVMGDCIYNSNDFYLKVISREGEVAGPFKYTIDYEKGITEYKKKCVERWGVGVC